MISVGSKLNKNRQIERHGDDPMTRCPSCVGVQIMPPHPGWELYRNAIGPITYACGEPRIENGFGHGYGYRRSALYEELVALGDYRRSGQPGVEEHSLFHGEAIAVLDHAFNHGLESIDSLLLAFRVGGRNAVLMWVAAEWITDKQTPFATMAREAGWSLSQTFHQTLHDR